MILRKNISVVDNYRAIEGTEIAKSPPAIPLLMITAQISAADYGNSRKPVLLNRS